MIMLYFSVDESLLRHIIEKDQDAQDFQSVSRIFNAHTHRHNTCTLEENKNFFVPSAYTAHLKMIQVEEHETSEF